MFYNFKSLSAEYLRGLWLLVKQCKQFQDINKLLLIDMYWIIIK